MLSVNPRRNIDDPTERDALMQVRDKLRSGGSE